MNPKFVFDLRNLQKQKLARYIRKQLHLVKDCCGDSAVFLLPKDMDIDFLAKKFRPAFSLAHVEQVSITKKDPYQIIRLESQHQNCENIEVG
jgi:hypothetical protein